METRMNKALSLLFAASMLGASACGGGSAAAGGETTTPANAAKDPQGNVVRSSSGAAVSKEAEANWKEATSAFEAADKAGWKTRTAARKETKGDIATGQGIAFAQRNGTRVAIVAEVDVNMKTGKVHARKFTVAHDCGVVINPRLLTQGIEGNICQGLSRAIHEEVKFSKDNVTSVDWETYPILDITERPLEINVVLINRQNIAPSGAGEGSMRPVVGAVANAIYDATGVRLRQGPFTAERLKAGMA